MAWLFLAGCCGGVGREQRCIDVRPRRSCEDSASEACRRRADGMRGFACAATCAAHMFPMAHARVVSGSCCEVSTKRPHVMGARSRLVCRNAGRRRGGCERAHPCAVSWHETQCAGDRLGLPIVYRRGCGGEKTQRRAAADTHTTRGRRMRLRFGIWARAHATLPGGCVVEDRALAQGRERATEMRSLANASPVCPTSGRLWTT